MADAYRDQNSVPTLIASSNVDGKTPVRVWADPVTHRLLVDVTSGSDTVFSPYTYLITNDSGTYNAYNGVTNTLDFSDTNFDVVMAAVIAAIGTTPALVEFGIGSFTTITGISMARGNIKLQGQGMGVTTIQLSASATDSTAILKIQATNVASGYALTANAVAGALTLTMSAPDAANLAAGDYIILRSNLDIDTEIPGRKQGDLYIVKSVSGTTVTLGVSTNGMNVRELFTTANSAAVDKLVFYENVSIEGISFTDLATSRSNSLVGGQTDFRYIYNLLIKDCSFRHMFYAGTRLFQTWHSRIEGCDFRDIFDTTPTQNTFYGIEVRGASSDTVICGNTFHNMRHGVTQGAGSSGVLAGRTRNLVIDGNSSSSTATAHFDCHQGAETVVISNNSCTGDDGAANAIQTRSNACITGNVILGILGKGISLFGAASGSTVSGNYIKGCTDGITVDSGVTDCQICDNIITQTGAGYPISFVSTVSAIGGTDSIVSGNYIYGNVTTTYGIAIDSSSNVLITNNKIKTSTAVRILTTNSTGTNVIVQNNFLSGLGGTPFQNFVASPTHMIIGNFGYNMKGAAGAVIATPFSAGAGNVTNTASTNAAPTSATLYTNVTSPKTYTVSGGTVSEIAINGIASTAAIGGVFNLGIGDTIKITYTVAPTVVVTIS